MNDVSSRSLIFLMIFSVCCVVSVILIPPFQSPDEFNHIKRAYAFSNGVFLNDIESNASGGLIDDNLKKYMEFFSYLPHHPEEKINKDILNDARSLYWSDARSFSEFSNTALYFPLAYLPQTIALTIGKVFNFSINYSYYLARIFSLLTILLFIYIAFRIYEPHPVVYFLLMMPISIFQCGSATADGIIFSMIILISSIFMAIGKNGYNRRLFLLMCFFIFIFTTHRINFYLLTFIPIILFLNEKRKIYIVSSILLSLSVLLWIFAAMKYTALPNRPVSMFDIAFYYISNPIKTIELFVNTITSDFIVKFYIKSFVGYIGWLDFAISYEKIRNILICISLVFIAFSKIKKLNIEKITALIIALISILTMYFIILVQWTDFPNATYIEGVQGRYFIPIIIMVSYTFAGINYSKLKNRVFFIVFPLYCFYSMHSLVSAILSRYYLV